MQPYQGIVLVPGFNLVPEQRAPQNPLQARVICTGVHPQNYTQNFLNNMQGTLQGNWAFFSGQREDLLEQVALIEKNPHCLDQQHIYNTFITILGSQQYLLISECINRSEFKALIHSAKLKLQGKFVESTAALNLLQLTNLQNIHLQVLYSFIDCIEHFNKFNNYTFYSNIVEIIFKNGDLGFIQYCSSNIQVFNAWLDFQNHPCAALLEICLLDVKLKEKFLLSPLSKLNDHIAPIVWSNLFFNPQKLSNAIAIASTPKLAVKFMRYLDKCPDSMAQLASVIIRHPGSLSLFENVIVSDKSEIDELITFIENSSNDQYLKLTVLLTYCPLHCKMLFKLLDWEKRNNTGVISSYFQRDPLIAPYLADLLEGLFYLPIHHLALPYLLSWSTLSNQNMISLLKSMHRVDNEWVTKFLLNISQIIRDNPQLLERALRLIDEDFRTVPILVAVGGMASRYFDISRFESVITHLEDTSFPTQEMASLLNQIPNRVLHENGIGDCIWMGLCKSFAQVKEIFEEAPYPYPITCWHLIDLVKSNDISFMGMLRSFKDIMGEPFSDIYNGKKLSEFLQKGPMLPLRFKRQLYAIILQGKYKLAHKMLLEWELSEKNRSGIESILERCLENNLVDEMEPIFNEFIVLTEANYLTLLFNNLDSIFGEVLSNLYQVKEDNDSGLQPAQGLFQLLMSRDYTKPLELDMIILLQLYMQKRNHNQGTFDTIYSLVRTPVNRLKSHEAHALRALKAGDLELAIACLDEEKMRFFASKPDYPLGPLKTILRAQFSPDEQERHSSSILESFTSNHEATLYQLIQSCGSLGESFRACSSDPEVNFHNERLSIVNHIVIHAVNLAGVINTTFLQKILSSELLLNTFDSYSFDNVLKKIEQLLTHPFLRLALEDLNIDQHQDGLLGFQNSPIALLTRVSFGLKCTEPVQRHHLVRMALMAFLYYNRQPQQVSSCVGVSRLGTLFSTAPISIINLIKDLCRTNTVIVDDTECYLGLMPSKVFFNSSFTYNIYSGQTTGAEGYSGSIKDIPYLTEIANHFNIPKIHFDEWLKRSISKYLKDHAYDSQGNVSIDSQGNVSIQHGAFAECLANQIPSLYFKPETILFIVRLICLSYSQPLMTRALEGLLISMDLTLDKQILRALELPLTKAIRGSYGINRKNLTGAIGRELLIELMKELKKRLVKYYDYDNGGKSVRVDRQEILHYPPNILDSRDKFITFILKVASECITQATQRFTNRRLATPSVNLENYKQKLFEAIKAPDFTNEVLTNFHSGGVSMTNQNSPWNPPSGAIATATNRATSIHTLQIHKIITHTADELLSLLCEYLETYNIRKPINGKKSGNMTGTFQGHAVIFQFNHFSVEYIGIYPSRVKNVIDEEIIKKSSNISKNLQIDHEAYRSIYQEIGSQIKIEPIQEEWNVLSQTPRDPTSCNLGNTRRILHNNLIKAYGSHELAKEMELLIDNILIKYIVNSSYANDISFIRIIDTNWSNLEEGQAINYALWFSPMTLRWELWQTLEDGSNQQKIPDSLFFDGQGFELYH